MTTDFFTTHSLFKDSKSRVNKRTVFSPPCCTTAITTPNCCTEEYLHSLVVSNFFKKKELIDPNA